jgi:hypothetical protein
MRFGTIVKLPAWAAPDQLFRIGGRLAFLESDLNEYAPSKAPLPSFNRSAPSIRLPFHSASAFRVGMKPPPDWLILFLVVSIRFSEKSLFCSPQTEVEREEGLRTIIDQAKKEAKINRDIAFTDMADLSILQEVQKDLGIKVRWHDAVTGRKKKMIDRACGWGPKNWKFTSRMLWAFSTGITKMEAEKHASAQNPNQLPRFLLSQTLFFTHEKKKAF